MPVSFFLSPKQTRRSEYKKSISLFQTFCLFVSWKIYFGFRLFLDSRRKRRDSEDDGDDGEDSAMSLIGLIGVENTWHLPMKFKS